MRLESSSHPVIALVAPAGYGKTVLLTQYASRTDRPVAWLNLDTRDADPTVLLESLAHTLHNAGMLSEGGAAVESGSALTRGVDQLLERIDVDVKGLLIIDHVDELPTLSSLDVLGALMLKARARLQVLVATRSNHGLPLGLLRAHGDLLELVANDLAFSSSEIEEIFASVGVSAPIPLDEIMAETEGWPTAVYLIALAMEAGAPAPGAGESKGSDLYLYDYLREEFMRSIPNDLESFLLRSSILPRMCGDICDFVLETHQSAQTLKQLEEANLLVIPLDRTRTWYRYHSLLREFLQRELRTHLGDIETQLHQRASTWFESHGSIELAIDHAHLAGDHERVAGLLTGSARSFYATGRNETLSGWLAVLEGTDVLPHHPGLAAIGALARSLNGDPGGAERMARSAYYDADGRPRDESQLHPLSLVLRSYQAPFGIERALEDARIAHQELQHDAEWAHVSLGALGLALHAVEGIAAAESIWADVSWRAQSIQASPLAAVASAMRAIAARYRNEWDAAEAIVTEAVDQIEEGGLDGYMTSALAYIEKARFAAHRRNLDEARAYIGAASRIRPLLTMAIPVYSVLTLHDEAEAFIELADIAGARRLMRDATDILALRPRLGMLDDAHDQLRQRLAILPAGTVGPSSLTGAELRLLPILVTHLTYPEIGDRLFVSKHTVKTQAMSIYRKLGVTSRSAAVEKARDIGLLSS